MSVPTKPTEAEPEPLYPPGPSQETSGVVPFPIQGRFKHIRQRLAGGYTDEDRAWRKQWLEDQILHPDEPVTPPNYEKERYNWIRRWGKVPLNIVMKPLEPIMGSSFPLVRYYTGRALMGVFATYWFWYYAKYNAHSWESRSGWKVHKNDGAVFPGEPGYPKVSNKTKPSDYGYQLTKENCPFI